MSGPLRFPPDARHVRQLRHDVRAAALALGVAAETCDALSLVVDELANNAIEHGSVYRKSNVELAVQISTEQKAVVLEFFDPEMPTTLVQELARALQDAAQGLPALDSERGRGLFLISIYMEELRVAVAPSGGLHLRGRLLAS